METSKVLIDNSNEYFSNALGAKNKAQFNTAVILFFKTLAALCDLFIYKKEQQIPSSHAERFRILENKSAVLYSIIDRDFPFYQDSYTKKMTKEVADLLEKDVRKTAQLVGVGLQEIL